LSDGQLLARFLAGHDQAGELAFEALVKRHGPMVQTVCRQVLADPADIHDAWQAVFLVLARRANAIRKRESLASWLHGVALRVAARARISAIRRGIRDRRTAEAAQAHALETLAAESPASCSIYHKERDGLIHHEVSRLPEKFRAPIVLCYLQGLTHDEAAASLSWPVGTVRSRLSRAKAALRRRLSRRGLVAPAVGALGAWLRGDQVALGATVETIEAGMAAEVVSLVSQVAVGRLSPAASGHLKSLAIADGVLKMFTLKKLSILAAALFSAGALTIASAVILVRSSQAQDAQGKNARPENKSAFLLEKPYKPAEQVDIDRQLQEMLKLAHSRFELQGHLYKAGQVGLDSLITAAEELEKAESYAAKNPADRKAAKERQLTRLKNIETQAAAMEQAGRVGIEELQGVKIRRMQAELDLKAGDDQNADLPALLRRLKELERKVEDLEKRVPRSLGGRM